jgi:hypothetical protein
MKSMRHGGWLHLLLGKRDTTHCTNQPSVRTKAEVEKDLPITLIIISNHPHRATPKPTPTRSLLPSRHPWSIAAAHLSVGMPGGAPDESEKPRRRASP